MGEIKRHGRSKFTPEIREMLLNARLEGLPVKTCAQYAGIGRTTLFYWLKKGEAEEDEEFAEFYREWEKAKSVFILKHLKKIEEAKDWKASQYLLAMTEPDIFNTHQWKNIKAEVKSESRVRIDDLFDEKVMREVLDGSDGPGESGE